MRTGGVQECALSPEEGVRVGEDCSDRDFVKGVLLIDDAVVYEEPAVGLRPAPRKYCLALLVRAVCHQLHLVGLCVEGYECLGGG